ncbi:MAG: MoaD/ThiS family protein [Acidobacteria bacterium]|nr:MoaD/ThiS family protein [Acidobacteriota bacterium]
MRVRVRYFSSLRDATGRSEETVPLEAPATLADLWEDLCRRCPALALHRGRVIPAVNLRHAPFDTPLADGDEAAFLPPVSGG